MSDVKKSREVQELYINELRGRLIESEARYSTIVDIAPDAIVVIDARQCIKLLNPKAEEIFGYSSDEAADRPLDLLLTEQVATIHRRYVREFSTGSETIKRMESRSAPIFGRRRDGTTFPAEVSIARLTQDGQPSFLAVVRELPAQKAAEGRPGFDPVQAAREDEKSDSGRLLIDSERHLVTLNGHPLRLSPTEFALLAFLRDEAPRVVSSQELVQEVQGYENNPAEARDIVRYHVYRIRRKAKADAGTEDLIRTVRGIGYALGDEYR
jgi:PAS domain S-box-containing protein